MRKIFLSFLIIFFSGVAYATPTPTVTPYLTPTKLTATPTPVYYVIILSAKCSNGMFADFYGNTTIANYIMRGTYFYTGGRAYAEIILRSRVFNIAKKQIQNYPNVIIYNFRTLSVTETARIK